MSILLTGATGFIGSSVLARLLDEGYSVTALVRDRAKAEVVEGAGATALIGDATDSDLVARAARESDGVIHLASAEDVDPVFIEAVLRGLEGSDKPFVHTGGIWSYGSNADITGDSPADPPAITAWRGATEARVLAVDGIRTAVVVPSVVYGRGTGIPNVIVDAPRGGEGARAALRMIGDGSQHWATVHVDDLAALYVLAFENGDAGAVYIGASGTNPTVRELSEAAAEAAGIAGVEAESDDESRERLGGAFADALLLDQQASGSKARIDLGWEPNGRSLVEELTSGSYASREGAAA